MAATRRGGRGVSELSLQVIIKIVEELLYNFTATMRTACFNIESSSLQPHISLMCFL
jgi:hypothetical protein